MPDKTYHGRQGSNLTATFRIFCTAYKLENKSSKKRYNTILSSVLFFFIWKTKILVYRFNRLYYSRKDMLWNSFLQMQTDGSFPLNVNQYNICLCTIQSLIDWRKRSQIRVYFILFFAGRLNSKSNTNLGYICLFENIQSFSICEQNKN